MHILKLALLTLAIAVAMAAGATITIPSTTVLGTDTFGGPTITLTSAVLPSDTLTLTARGEVFLQSGNTYGTNAAGVITTAGSTGVGGANPNGSTTFGALLMGNSLENTPQIPQAEVSTGLGSRAPLKTIFMQFGGPKGHT